MLAGANVNARIGPRDSTVNGGGTGGTGGTTASSIDTNGKKRVSRRVPDPILDAAPETGTAAAAAAAAGFPTANLPHIYEPAGSRRGSNWSLLSKSRKSGGSSVYGGDFSLPDLPFSETRESVAASAPAGDPDMEWMARAMVCFLSFLFPPCLWFLAVFISKNLIFFFFFHALCWV